MTIIRVEFETDFFFGERVRAGKRGKVSMLAFCTGPSEISVALAPPDARWLSEEMSFLAEFYRSKAGSSERQFGEDDNVAAASFWETALKCQRLSVALQQAVGRGNHASSTGCDQRIDLSPATDLSNQALAPSKAGDD
jgi:hypothetical protein